MEEPKIKNHHHSLSTKSAELFFKKNKRRRIFDKELAKEIEALCAQELRIKARVDQISKQNHKIRPLSQIASAPFVIPAVFLDSDRTRYGSMAKDIEALCAQALRIEDLRAQKFKQVSFASAEEKDESGGKLEVFHHLVDPSSRISEQASPSEGHSFTQPLAAPAGSSLSDLRPIIKQEEKVFINLEDDHDADGDKEKLTPIMIVDSEDEEQQQFHRSTEEEMDVEENSHQISAAVECLPDSSKNMAFSVECPKVKGSETQMEGEDAGSCSSNVGVGMSKGVDQVWHSAEENFAGEEVDVKLGRHMDDEMDMEEDDHQASAAAAEGLADIPQDMAISAEDSKVESSEKQVQREDATCSHEILPTNSKEEEGTLPNMDVKIGSPTDDVDTVSQENMRSPPLDVETDNSFHGMDNMVIEESSTCIDGGNDDLANIWKEMAFSLECSKDIGADSLPDQHEQEEKGNCEHLFILKDDVGYVCRICGLIQRGIETIFEFVYSKGKKSTRTYLSERRNSNMIGMNEDDRNRVKSSEKDVSMAEVCAHPSHWKQMKAHQMEGFNFLCRNLLVDDPGGCILAHAPGSGKTFMIISFVQSFLAMNPQGKPLVILPKGIMATWRKEFERWQVEDIPLLDFYTSKAETRSQQLDVLKQWVSQKSILFLGYQQFSVIVCDKIINKVSADCRDILLKEPSILILDEGHTPRNENTNVIHSLAMVKTPLKVVLSGTLYQNHVKEVFNILNLVRPKFLMSKTSQAIVARIMSRVQIPAARKQVKATSFFDSVEYTLQKDEEFDRKIAVIKDLREMTREVLHYYKGDFLDELPGLVDLTVVLHMSARQKDEMKVLRELNKFKQISAGSAMYVHPDLLYLHPLEKNQSTVDDESIDDMLERLDAKHGVKLKFFLRLLRLCESNGEKLLVFSQFILPLKVLERISMMRRGWRSGIELFTITGDSSSEHRESSMELFNNSPDAKVLFGSIKACGEGISLVGASRILILDVHLNPSVTRQAIGRAFRPGQKKKVYTYRLVAADSPEEEDYQTCFRKEMISKMWFEWNVSCGHQDFKVTMVDADQCDDPFLENSVLRDDVKVLYKR